jgi:flagellin FlaB
MRKIIIKASENTKCTDGMPDMGKNRLIRPESHDTASIGIGAMIVFIAMVLVAGIAASVLIQTSTRLEAQAMTTGTQTVGEVAGGLTVTDVVGHVNGDIDALGITIRCRAGSPNIDLNHSTIIMTDSSLKVVLRYNYSNPFHYNSTVSTTDASIFGFSYSNLSNERYGIIVASDPDSSLSRFTPVINAGDKIILMVNADACFNKIGERTEVFGYIFPEFGSPAVISFNAPKLFTGTIEDLQ